MFLMPTRQVPEGDHIDGNVEVVERELLYDIRGGASRACAISSAPFAAVHRVHVSGSVSEP